MRELYDPAGKLQALARSCATEQGSPGEAVGRGDAFYDDPSVFERYNAQEPELSDPTGNAYRCHIPPDRLRIAQQTAHRDMRDADWDDAASPDANS